MSRSGRWVVGALVVLGFVPARAADEDKEKGQGRLTHLEAPTRDDLDGVVSVAISSDGKFAYGASWKGGKVVVLARDAKSGKLEHKQTVEGGLEGTTALSLSPDGKSAIATAFQASTAILFSRNPENGELTATDVAQNGENDVKFGMPIDAAFSPDGKFAYVIDDSVPGEDSQGAIVTFRVDDGKLKLVASDGGKDNCYSGARGVAFSPDGKTVYVASYRANTLVVADRDPATGKTTVRQIIKDGENGANALEGAMGVAVSPDGKSVYVSSGRFQGDNAISAFSVGSDGRLSFLQEFLDAQGDLQGFKGGNHLIVSPDGKNVYASATVSCAVAAFRRDPATGKLTYLQTLPDGGDGGENGAASVGISPDGKYVYVATEDRRALSVFQRDDSK